MRYRTFGRLGWKVSEVGYGMWGLAGWTGRDDAETRQSLRLAVDLGCNFFDTALAYGEGHSEGLLGELVRANPGKGLIVASKIPPKNRVWPSRRGFQLADVFPPDYIRSSTDVSLKNLGLPAIDLMQFHVWEDAWAGDDRWQKAVADLKAQGLVKAFGISVNRWEPANTIAALRTGLIDAVQVIYNIFDQNPEDELFPVCRDLGVAVIARVPFDEGSLTGTLTANSTWPEGDWRNTYFVRENLLASVERADRLKPLVPDGSSMPDMALRFILSNPDVATVIPGMRKEPHVRANLASSDAGPLPRPLLAELKGHGWVRTPTEWSQ
ncbi:MAG TPA: aldo/keto reductase [Gemmataceae bacterium]|jgi:aryl-alcohol dehydrogenase-like predicted oxidoreductase|nr:aldo/keto reductase [Gemmataceae bacterium]